MTDEIWKDIIDYPNYKISNLGRIWSNYKKDFMILNNHNKRYYQIKLSNKGKRKPFLVHRLVALAFIPNPNNLPEIDHINNIKTDNRLDNLRWVNRSQNNHNKRIQKNNTTGYKNIIIVKGRKKKYKVSVYINKVHKQKYFYTIEEAIEYRDNYRNVNNLDL